MQNTLEQTIIYLSATLVRFLFICFSCAATRGKIGKKFEGGDKKLENVNIVSIEFYDSLNQ